MRDRVKAVIAGKLGAVEASRELDITDCKRADYGSPIVCTRSVTNGNATP